MSSPESMDVLSPLRRAAEAGRLAHAFLIVGSPEGQGRQLALTLARLLNCTAADKPCGVCVPCQQIEERAHPDTYWMEPEKKKRIIPVGDPKNRTRDPGIRYRLLEPLAQTAYAGGWKVGIILWADRMTDEAANALLKTLEEPPRKTLLLLVTEEPQNLLPTIVSRCQRINLGERERPPEAAWRPELDAWLAEGSASGPLTAIVRAARLLDLLERIKASLVEEVEGETEAYESEAPESEMADVADEASESQDDEVERTIRDARVQTRMKKERAAVLRAILLWHRDVLACRLGADPGALQYPGSHAILKAQSQGVSVGALFGRIRAVDQARSRLENNLNAMQVLESMVQAGV